MFKDLVDWVFGLISRLWSWATKEINSLVNLPWSELPVWKWYLAVMGLSIVVGLLAWAVYSMWEAIRRLFLALGGLLYSFFLVLPQVLAAGLVAYLTLFIIQKF